MKRVFIAIQWLVLAFLLVSLVFFFFRKDTPPEYAPAGWSAWGGFYALAVEGVLDTDDPRYLTPAKLDEYLSALREAGYKAITPEDVDGYYYHDRPLPEKAVLLMFEGGRKDHIIRATPKLIQNKFIGTLFVPTSVTRKWGNHFVSQSNLRRISRSANWRLASMGHEAIETIEVSNDGATGNFLSSRRWTRQGWESDGSFQERVFRDYEKAAQILRRAAGRPAVAYLYPYGDAGEGRRTDPLAETINQGAVRQHHRVAFTQEGSPLNEYNSDPLALSRLRLRGDWSGTDLIETLESWSSDRRPVSGFALKDRWQFRGTADLTGQTLLLNENSSAVLRGSGSWKDLTLNASLETAPGAIGVVYVRYSGPHSYLRVTVNRDGLRVQEKRAGKLRTLSRLSLRGKKLKQHQIELTLKDNRLWVEHNGVAFARSVPVSRKTKTGSVWIEANGGPVNGTAFEAEPISPLYVIGADYHGMSEREKNETTALLPYWFKSDRMRQLAEDRQLAVMLAAQDGLATIPVIESGTRLSLKEARALSSELSRLLSRLTVRMLLREFVITGYQPDVHRTFLDQGLYVSYLVDVVEAETLLAGETKLSRYERLLVYGEEERVLTFAERYEGALPPDSLVLAVGKDVELPDGMERAIDAVRR